MRIVVMFAASLALRAALVAALTVWPASVRAQRTDDSRSGLLHTADTTSAAATPRMSCGRSISRGALAGALITSFAAVVAPRVTSFGRPTPNSALEDALIGGAAGAVGFGLVFALSQPCGPLPYPWNERRAARPDEREPAP